jgi:hypothetical protein
MFKKTLEKFVLKTGKSFSIENFFCRLNFDFSIASHSIDSDQNLSFLPIVNNNKIINRECLIDEAGQMTRKYYETLNLLKKTTRFELNRVKLSSNLIDNSNLNFSTLSKLEISHVLTFDKFSKILKDPIKVKERNEDLNAEHLSKKYKIETHNNAYFLYRLKNVNFTIGTEIQLNLDLIKDYAILICDFNKHLITINPVRVNSNSRLIKISLNFDCNSLDILVENLGRSSSLSKFKSFLEQRKGLLSINDAQNNKKSSAIAYKLPHSSLKNVDSNAYQIFFIDFLPQLFNRITFNSNYINLNHVKNKKFLLDKNRPIFFYTKFNVNKRKSDNSPERLYLLLNSFTKGVVFVNGFNIGRYWNFEGQKAEKHMKTLHVPNDYLLNGENEIILFDLHGVSSTNGPFIYLTNQNVY